MSTKKAITYYKLESNYEGDITKYCGLAGTEIDANFYFLRGNDIADAEWDATTKILKLIRVNGETIEVPFKCCCCDMCGTSLTGSTTPSSSTAAGICDCCVDDIYYDKATATLHYISKGIDKVIEGFYSSKEFRTDYTLEGDGSDADPLRISSVMDSGKLAPAIGFIDLTDNAEEKESLPATPEYGERYVTHEWVSPYGMLFNFAAVEAINDILSKNNDGWRVPTKEDWDAMLNGVELCDEDRNHRSLKSSPYLGKWAGAYLKSLDADWAAETVAALKEHEIWKNYGFDILPAGDYYEGRNHSYGKIGAYWTSTMCEDGDVWIKKFHGNKNTIQQRAAETDLFMSIRLVKDLEKGYHETEVIEGVPYNTIIMPSLDEKGNLTHKVWTVQNISMSTIMEGDTRYPKAKAKPVLRDIECTDGTTGTPAPGEYKYFINEWETEEWVKREITEGMSLILETGVDGSTDEEWIINDGKLVKNSEVLYSKVKDYVDEAIQEEVSARTAADEELAASIEEEASVRAEADDVLQEEIDYEVSARTEADEILAVAIEEEASARTEADEALQEAIDKEASARTETDEALQEAIDKEVSARTEADELIKESVSEEVERLNKIDEDLANAIGAEGDAESGYTIDLCEYEYFLLDSDNDLIASIDSLLIAKDSSVIEVFSEEELTDVLESKEYKYVVFNGQVGHPDEHKYYERLSDYEYITNADNLVDAVKELDLAVQDEVSARTDADEALQDAIQDETDSREKNDKALGAKIDDEIVDRKAGDEELEESIKAEATERKEEDAELAESISAETIARNEAIEEEAKKREANDIKTVAEPLVIDKENDAKIVNNNGDTVVTISVDFDFGTF